jgi:uncharacterized protein YdeI (YjbR/CyaY-like superfamily)
VAEYREVSPTSRTAWRAWLQKHHAASPGVWLLLAKKRSGLRSPSYTDAVEEALCFGWIDGLLNPLDDKRYKQLFTPRKPKSAWAASNKARVARLTEQGLMAPAGRRAVEIAQANGSWGALDHVEALDVPPDLQRALHRNAAAKRQWAACTAGHRKQFLYWLANARREETRVRRIGQIVEWVASKTTPAKAYEARRKRTTPATSRG